LHRNIFIVTFALVLLVSACGTPAPAVSEETATMTEAASPVVSEAGVSGDLVIYSGRSEPLIQPVIDAFKVEYPDVNVLLKAGSNSELANALIEEQANPQADIFITTELFTIQALAQQDIFQSYLPASADLLPAEFIGPDNKWIGLTRRARVIMYNSDLVSPDELPSSIFDLTDPKWQGQVAAAGSTNGSMQAQIAAMRQLIGEEATEEWLRGLIANDVTFFGGHTDVRKAVGAGEFKLGLVNHYYLLPARSRGQQRRHYLPRPGRRPDRVDHQRHLGCDRARIFQPVGCPCLYRLPGFGGRPAHLCRAELRIPDFARRDAPRGGPAVGWLPACRCRYFTGFARL
jgi:ABC-type thiamine transport system substrate-binding protein